MHRLTRTDSALSLTGADTIALRLIYKLNRVWTILQVRICLLTLLCFSEQIYSLHLEFYRSDWLFDGRFQHIRKIVFGSHRSKFRDCQRSESQLCRCSVMYCALIIPGYAASTMGIIFIVNISV